MPQNALELEAFRGDRQLKQCFPPLGARAGLLIASLVFLAAISGGSQELPGIRGFRAARVGEERLLEQKLQAIPDPARAEANLRHLTSEPHMAGTEASHKVAEWLRDQYRSFGFDADIVTYKAWLPLPRETKLELVAPQFRALASPEKPFERDPDTFDKRAVAGFNTYSPSGDVTAPIVYVNYGMPEDYRVLDSLGVSVAGKLAIARYGQGFRGIKTKLAEEHKAAGLIIYSDPVDDGYVAGDTLPDGPWRPMSGIQRGSILYTQIYPGDPLTPGVGPTPATSHVSPADSTSLPHIPTLPINAKDAAVILDSLTGRHVPHGWQGGLPFTYHLGGNSARVHLKIVMDYAERPIYDVIAKLHGANDDEWVILGNHHDAWVFGAARSGSGTASMLEAARALGELARSGWQPRRTLVICQWDGEEPGLIGSTDWVAANRAELQAKALAYINTDVGVTGPNFSAAATPSLKEFVRDAARRIEDPATKGSVYDAWRGHVSRIVDEASGMARKSPKLDSFGEAPVGALGAGSDFSPFLDYAGIPSIDIGFGGDYGVYHSLYDDFYWMKHFGDPSFVYHAALARMLATLALRLDEADILPFDYAAYASEISRVGKDMVARASQDGEQSASLKPVTEASAELTASASRASVSLRTAGSSTLDPEIESELNHALASVEQALLAQNGLAGRPWFKHTIFAREVMLDMRRRPCLVSANRLTATIPPRCAWKPTRSRPPCAVRLTAWTKCPGSRSKPKPLLWRAIKPSMPGSVPVHPPNEKPIRKVCVYCASSADSHAIYLDSARRLGEILAENSIVTVYGGGSVGSMGRVADGALSRGGKVIGVIPRFMQELEWDHKGLTELQVVENMRERKHIMLTDSDAAIALPGGSGTLEELMEAISLKRLGIYLNPIVLVNVRGFYDPLLALLRHCIDERFMDPRHAAMWQVAIGPEDVLPAIRSAARWTHDTRRFATVKPKDSDCP